MSTNGLGRAMIAHHAVARPPRAGRPNFDGQAKRATLRSVRHMVHQVVARPPSVYQEYARKRNTMCVRGHARSLEGKKRQGPQYPDLNFPMYGSQLVNNKSCRRSHCDVDCRCRRHMGCRNVFAVADCYCRKSWDRRRRNVWRGLDCRCRNSWPE